MSNTIKTIGFKLQGVVLQPIEFTIHDIEFCMNSTEVKNLINLLSAKLKCQEVSQPISDVFDEDCFWDNMKTSDEGVIKSFKMD